MSATRFPLTWPAGQQRTPPGHRKKSPFSVTFGKARDELQRELDRHHAADVILSTNCQLNLAGMPRSEREPADPGVAVYFVRKGTAVAFACDTYQTVTGNLRAVGLTLDALRRIERYGATEMLDRAFTGFAQLPAHVTEPPWWEVLGVTRNTHPDLVKARRDELALVQHPDAGGTHDEMARINRAYDRYLEELERAGGAL